MTKEERHRLLDQVRKAIFDCIYWGGEPAFIRAGNPTYEQLIQAIQEDYKYKGIKVVPIKPHIFGLPVHLDENAVDGSVYVGRK